MQSKHLFALFAGAVLISFSGVFVKGSGVPPEVSSFYRLFFGAVFLAAYCLLRGIPLFYKVRRPLLLLLVALFFSSDILFWHASIIYVGPGLATLLANLEIFLLGLVGVLFMGERFIARGRWSFVLVAIGLALLLGVRWQVFGADYHLGVLFGVLTAVSYAVFVLGFQYLMQDQHEQSANVSILFRICLLACICVLVWVVASGGDLRLHGYAQLGWMAAYGLFCQALGWILIGYGLAASSASLAGFVLLVQPGLSFVWDLLWFDKDLLLAETVGLFLILLSIYLNVSGRKVNPQAASGKDPGGG